MFTITPFIPASAPACLHPLFTETTPGNLITYSVNDNMLECIKAWHDDLPAVKRYVDELGIFLLDPNGAERTTPLGAKRVLTAKSHMIDAVLAYYGTSRHMGKGWWVKRAYAFFHELTEARQYIKTQDAVMRTRCGELEALNTELRARIQVLESNFPG